MNFQKPDVALNQQVNERKTFLFLFFDTDLMLEQTKSQPWKPHSTPF
jgi:hypothetical protein